MPPRLNYANTRPYAVVDDLAELAGPTHGVVELPRELDWTPQRYYDLDRPSHLRVFYQTVLNQALDPAELGEFLNAGILLEIWPELWLPLRVRKLWEQQFPQLIAAQAA